MVCPRKQDLPFAERVWSTETEEGENNSIGEGKNNSLKEARIIEQRGTKIIAQKKPKRLIFKKVQPCFFFHLPSLFGSPLSNLGLR